VSVPARSVAPSLQPRERVDGASHRRSTRPRSAGTAQRDRLERHGLHLTFWLFSAAVASSLVVGVVALSAELVQAQYAMRAEQQKSAALQVSHGSLVDEVAQLSSPARVAAWARGHGMVTPTNVVILRIPGTTTPGDLESPGGGG
jgi:cell division protein FtsL